MTAPALRPLSLSQHLSAWSPAGADAVEVLAKDGRSIRLELPEHLVQNLQQMKPEALASRLDRLFERLAADTPEAKGDTMSEEAATSPTWADQLAKDFERLSESGSEGIRARAQNLKAACFGATKLLYEFRAQVDAALAEAEALGTDADGHGVRLPPEYVEAIAPGLPRLEAVHLACARVFAAYDAEDEAA